jgi:hypothetical protein
LVLTYRMRIVAFGTHLPVGRFKPYIMRNLVLLFTVLILGTTSTMAAVTAEDKVVEYNAYRYNDSFIFVEEGITFSVYPDGEFDFYIDKRIGKRRRNVTFNSGYDYSPYAQYDDYGAVIQVENIPIYYDYYGRVSQVGDVNINYRNGRVRSVGGMYVYYNNRGYYDYHTGYINVYNRYYTWSPWHAFFARPSLGFCLVYNNPYRRWYNPIRYTYYNPYRYNKRWSYAKIGKEHRYNKTRRERASVYRNDKRVAVRENRGVRSNRTALAQRGSNAARTNRAITNRDKGTVRNNRTVRRNSDVRSSGSRKVAGRTAVDRSKQIESRTVNRSQRPATNRSVTKRSTTVRSPRQSTVTKRSVTRTPQRKTVSRSTTVRKPQTRAPKAVSKAPSRSRSSVSTRSGSRQKVVSKAPSRSSKTYSRSSSSSSRVSKAPSRNSRSNSRSTTARSGKRL